MVGQGEISRRTVLAVGGIGLGVVAFGLAGCTSPNTAAGAGAGGLESPLLASRVKAGTLPKLADRLPASPMVVKPLNGPGKFGGTFHRGSLSQTDTNAYNIFSSVGLLEWNWAGTGPQPSLAESYTATNGNRTFTFHLRKGLKWSDGEPFTADDIEFGIVGCFGNTELTPTVPGWLADVDGKNPDVSADGKYTITLTYRHPNAMLEKYMSYPAASWQVPKPKHYLQKFHPGFTDPSRVAAAAKAAGYSSWVPYFTVLDNPWTNPDLPTLGAYHLQSASGQSGTAIMERNPYFWKTDPDGRQLPYIDHVQVQVLDQAAMDLRASNGDFELQGDNLIYSSTQVYMKNAGSHGYKVLRWQSTGSLLCICPNLAHPNLAIRQLFLNKDFRQALSYAIDRNTINQALLGGLGVVHQPESYGPEYGIKGGGKVALKFDKNKANKLLDGLGLKQVGGVRTLTDGTQLEFNVMYVDDNTEVPRANALELVQKNWAAVGVKLNLQPVDSTLYLTKRQSNDYDFDGTPVPTDDNWDLEPVYYVPIANNSHFAPAYGQWYSTKGQSGIEPPEEFKKMLNDLQSMRVATSAADRVSYGRSIMKQHDEQTYMIGLVSPPFSPVIVKDNVKNVRNDNPQLSYYYEYEAITKPEQVYFA